MISHIAHSTTTGRQAIGDEDGNGNGVGIVGTQAPVSWDVLLDGTKRPLESHFHIDENGDYGFEVVGHDAKLPMVIDPTFVPAPTIVAPANGGWW